MISEPTSHYPKTFEPDRDSFSSIFHNDIAKAQSAISPASSLLKSIWDNSLVGMRLTNLNGEMVAVNRAFCTIVEKTEAELIGKSFTMIYDTTTDVDDVLERYQTRFHRDAFKASMEKSLTLWTGKEITLEVQSSYVWSDEGEKLLLSIFRDITSAKRTEQALRASEQKLRSVYDNVKDVIFTISREGIIESINREFERSSGWSESDWIGKPFRPLIHPQDLRKAWLSFRDAARGGTETVAELRVQTKDGGYRTGEFTWSPQFENGRLERVLGCVRDVTRRREMEIEVRESEKRFRGLFENSLQPMFQSSVDGKLLNVNRAFLKTFGYQSLLELVDVNVASLYVDRSLRDTVLSRSHQQGFLSNFEMQLKRKDGSIITVVENSRALRNEEGEIVGFEGILEDVTVRRSMERKLGDYVLALEHSQKALGELNAQKDKLFSVLSHDLRSPFASILGFCEILLEDDAKLDDTERRQFTSYIMESAQDQLALVNKLLDWSRLETGRIRLDMTDLNLSQTFEKAIRSLMGLASRKRIAISSSIPADVTVRGDGQLLQDVFCNLVSNALKFTPAEGTITATLKERTTDTITIAITDSGVGIPEKDLPRLFRVEEKYTRPGLNGEKGTGFGLPLCAEIMEKHGGSISAQSQPGRGTTISLTFTHDDRTDVTKVLIVDDEEGARVLHARYIQRSHPNLAVIHASNGSEGIRAAMKHKPRLIISDYAMPGMNGFEMIDQLKNDPLLKSIPVIVITGENSKASREAMLLSGAARVFVKPVVAKDLEEAVRTLIE